MPLSKSLNSDAALSRPGYRPPDALRANLHRMADWAADYRENIEQLPIAPTVSSIR